MMRSPEMRDISARAQDAVANAAMVAQAVLTKRLRVAPHIYYDLDSNAEPMVAQLEQRTIEETQGMCYQGSAIALSHLLSPKYYGVFNAMAIIVGHDARGIQNIWGDHAYFLIRDVEGTWYAGSPANHWHGVSRLTRIFSNQNIAQLLHDIRAIEGGTWPSVEHIIRSLNTFDEHRPKVEGKNAYVAQLEALGIDHENRPRGTGIKCFEFLHYGENLQ